MTRGNVTRMFVAITKCWDLFSPESCHTFITVSQYPGPGCVPDLDPVFIVYHCKINIACKNSFTEIVLYFMQCNAMMKRNNNL